MAGEGQAGLESKPTWGHGVSRAEPAPEEPAEKDGEDGDGDEREEKKEASPKGSQRNPQDPSSPMSSTRFKLAAGSPSMTGYFEDELPGYRLLKASVLQNSERQQILSFRQ